MSDLEGQMRELNAAVHAFWVALADAHIYPADRGILFGVFVVGNVVGVTDGMGLLSPLYAAVLVVLAAALAWVIDALARAKI